MLNLVPQSFEKNLCELARVASVGDALSRMGLIGKPSSDVVLEEVQGWMPGGAETYIYRFRVLSRDQCTDVIAKAVVAFSMAKSLSELGSEWVRRRRLLEYDGIRTPKLYFAGNAMLIEEFIPYKLSGFLGTTSKQRDHLSAQVIQLAAVLENNGFRPISAFGDLRTDGEDVFAVDFGEDLGPPAVAKKHDNRLLREAIGWLNKNRGKSDPVNKTHARAIFKSTVAETKKEGI